MMLIGQSFLFVAIIKVIPQIADTLIAGVSMSTASGGAAVRGGASGAAGLAAGAMVAAYNMPGKTADVIGGGVSAVQSAASAYSANFNSYRNQGLNSVRAGVSALGSTIWAGYQASRGQENPGTQNSMAAKNFNRGVTTGAATSNASGNTSATTAISGTPETPKSSSEAEEPSPASRIEHEEKEQESREREFAEPAYSAPGPEELSKKFRNWD
jgi:hypothetical protein